MRATAVCLQALGLLFSAGCAMSPPGHPYAGGQSLSERVARAERRHLRQMQRDGVPVRGANRTGSDLSAPLALALSEFGERSGVALTQSGHDEPVRSQPGDRSSANRGPLPSFWGTVHRDLKRLPRSLWDDTKAVYTDPGNLVILASAGAASLTVRVTGVDGKIDDSHGRHDTFQDEWSDAIGVLGNPGTHFALAGVWYLVGQQAQDAKTYEVSRTLFNALTINGVSTLLLKAAAGTGAPNGENHAWPSGHTSSSFTMAEVLRVSYGPWVGVPSYALATLAAFGRIDDREHDFSDVIFGAALGIVVGHTVAEGHRPEVFGGEITPYVSPNTGAGGIAWVKSF